MRAYQNIAFPLGIIKANIVDYDVWLCNRLINCSNENNLIEVIDDDLWSEKEGLANSELIYLEREEFNQNVPDILAKNKEVLEQGRYIIGNYDEFYAPGKESYQKRHFNHDYVIFGYDDEEGVFKSAAYMPDGKYQFFDITYEDYYNSITKSIYGYWVYYRKIHKSYKPQVDILYIHKQLENYLLSRADDRVSDRQASFGMEVWERFKEHVQEVENSWLDNRYSRLYIEHKDIMLKRINKLHELGFFNDSTLTEEYYCNVYISARTVHYLFLKYNLTGDNRIRQRILDIIQKTNESEKCIIGRLI